MMYPKMFVRMCEIIQLLGAGGLVAVPSFAEFDGPASGDVTTYFQAANADAGSRIKLFRLAFDAAVSSFAGRQQLYERYYSGDPVRLASTLWGLYEKDTHIDRITRLLDDLASVGVANANKLINNIYIIATNLFQAEPQIQSAVYRVRWPKCWSPREALCGFVRPGFKGG